MGIIGLHGPFTASPEETAASGVAGASALPGLPFRALGSPELARLRQEDGRREGAAEPGRGGWAGGGQRTGNPSESVQPLQKNSPTLLIFAAKLSSFSLHLFTGKDAFGALFPFGRFTELLEGVAAAETCSGEKHALSPRRKRASLQCLAFVRKQNLLSLFDTGAAGYISDSTRSCEMCRALPLHGHGLTISSSYGALEITGLNEKSFNNEKKVKVLSFSLHCQNPEGCAILITSNISIVL